MTDQRKCYTEDQSIKHIQLVVQKSIPQLEYIYKKNIYPMYALEKAKVFVKAIQRSQIEKIHTIAIKRSYIKKFVTKNHRVLIQYKIRVFV